MLQYSTCVELAQSLQLLEFVCVVVGRVSSNKEIGEHGSKRIWQVLKALTKEWGITVEWIKSKASRQK